MTILRHSHFDVDNLDKLMMIFKDQLDGAKIDCVIMQIIDFLVVEVELIVDNQEELIEIGYFNGD